METKKQQDSSKEVLKVQSGVKAGATFAPVQFVNLTTLINPGTLMMGKRT